MAYPYYTSPPPEYGLANQANQFMQQQARVPFMMNLPGYASNVGQRGLNTGAMLRGQVPDDVVQQIQQRAGERGIATGIRNEGPNTNTAWLRALGLTSLGLQQQGSEQLSRSMADTPQAELWNPMSLYVPERKAAAELAVAQQGKSGSGWLRQDQQPWFRQSHWSAPNGAFY